MNSRNPAAVLFNVSGSAVGVPGNPLQVSGSVAVYTQGAQLVSGTVTASVTGTVNLNRGNTTAVPLFVSGSVGIGGPIDLARGNVVGTPVFISGSVGIGTRVTVVGSVNTHTQGAQNVSGSVAVYTQGAQLVSGTVFVTTTGSFPVTLPTSTASSTSNVTATGSATTLLAANSNRKGATIYNDSNKNLYVKLGSGASTTSFTVKMVKGAYYEVPFNYRGIITGIWDTSPSGVARVTEVT